MALNKELINKVLTVTSKAAISCHKFLGKNDCKFYNKSYYRKDDNVNGSRFPLDNSDIYIY